MQNEEIVKAEPKGMQINYVYIFFTDGTSMFRKGEKLDKRQSISSRANIQDDGSSVLSEADTLS